MWEKKVFVSILLNWANTIIILFFNVNVFPYWTHVHDFTYIVQCTSIYLVICSKSRSRLKEKNAVYSLKILVIKKEWPF